MNNLEINAKTMEYNNQDLRICLIGTSNSVFKDGYAKGISTHPSVKHLTKLSIGASPSIIIPYFLTDHEIDEFDLIIFETAINDRNYYINKSINSSQIYQFIKWGIFKAAKAKTKVALLIMPTKTAFDWETISEKIYKNISIQSDCFLFNGFDYIRNSSSLGGVPIYKHFKDEFHLHENIEFQLGRTFIDSFLRTKTNEPHIVKEQNYRKATFDKNNSFIKRKTSLMEKHFNILDENNTMTIKLSKNEFICGISLNAAKSFGIIKIEGQKTIYKNINTNFIKSGKKYANNGYPYYNSDTTRS